MFLAASENLGPPDLKHFTTIPLHCFFAVGGDFFKETLLIFPLLSVEFSATYATYFTRSTLLIFHIVLEHSLDDCRKLTE